MRLALAVALMTLSTSPGGGSDVRHPVASTAAIEGIYPSIEELYVDLHRNPELSRKEERTSRRMGEGLRALGFEVTEKVGGYGVVGVLRNGRGPTVLVRTELDALPVKEETGLPYASAVVAADHKGQSVPVMHACGHDLHMASWMGAATLLARSRARWSGTLVMIGQPAEELISGARAMLADGLYTRFPRPDFAIAIHDSADFPAGQVAVASGPLFGNANSVEIVVRGRGGHASQPHRTVDPIVIAARLVMTLQTLVSRETKPTDPAVVTIGSIHGGLKSNIIPDEVKLALTVRSYDPAVQTALLQGVDRIAKAEALAARAPEPIVQVLPDGANVTWNDPVLTERLKGALVRSLGADSVVPTEPTMGAEDFSELGRPSGVPAVMLRLGVANPAKLQQAKAAGETLPTTHSSKFAPDLAPSLRRGVTVLTISAFELLAKP